MRASPKERYALIKLGKTQKCPQCGNVGARPYETNKCGEKLPVWECLKCENTWPRDPQTKMPSEARVPSIHAAPFLLGVRESKRQEVLALIKAVEKTVERKLNGWEKRLFVMGIMVGQDITFGAWYNGLKVQDRDYVQVLMELQFGRRAIRYG